MLRISMFWSYYAARTVCPTSSLFCCRSRTRHHKVLSGCCPEQKSCISNFFFPWQHLQTVGTSHNSMTLHGCVLQSETLWGNMSSRTRADDAPGSSCTTSGTSFQSILERILSVQKRNSGGLIYGLLQNATEPGEKMECSHVSGSPSAHVRTQLQEIKEQLPVAHAPEI